VVHVDPNEAAQIASFSFMDKEKIMVEGEEAILLTKKSFVLQGADEIEEFMDEVEE
jgi:hypothetical protein